MKDILYEVHYYDKDSANIIDNFLNLENNHGDIKLIKINDDMLDSIHKDSPTYLLRSLYTCKSFAICSKDNKSLVNKNNAGKILGYKSTFANIFIFGKETLSDEYLESRKALYKSFMTLKQERIESIEKEKERISNLNFKEYKKELRVSKQYVIFNENKTKDSNNIESNLTNKDSIKSNIFKSIESKHIQNNLILESKDKSIKIIFLDSNNLSLRELQNNSWQSNQQNNLDSIESNLSPTHCPIKWELDSIESNISMSNLIHIYNNKIDIFTKDKSIIDIESLEQYVILSDSKTSNLDSNILDSNLLKGRIESNIKEIA